MISSYQLNRIMEARPAGKQTGIVMSLVQYPQLVGFAGEIPQEDVIEYENFHHVTIRYGVKEYNPTKLQLVLGSMKSNLDTDGGVTGVGCFEGVQNGNCDCIILEIGGRAKKALERIKHVVEKTLECEENTFTEYKPHITIAYVKLGKGKEIAKMLGGKFMKYELDTLWLDEISVHYSDGVDNESTIYFDLMPSDED